MSAASVVLALGSMGIGIGVAGTVLPVSNGASWRDAGLSL